MSAGGSIDKQNLEAQSTTNNHTGLNSTNLIIPASPETADVTSRVSSTVGATPEVIEIAEAQRLRPNWSLILTQQ